MSKAITIRIKSETHKRLKNFGTLGDTFDSLINKALDCLERERETEAMMGKWHPLQKKLADESYKPWGYEIEKEVDKPI
jgi:hypothetical protein